MQYHNTSTFNPVLSVLNGLLKLSHTDKLRAVNILLREIAAEEGVSLETEQNSLEDRKKRFFDQANQYHLQLPENYRFNREEANAR